MSKTKSYNQIIFLTTLSVYLGLVLVGASPQVLAQAALTSKFEIKDQIEKQDDLDKKPDEGCQQLGVKSNEKLQKFSFNRDLFSDYAGFVKTLIDLEKEIPQKSYWFEINADYNLGHFNDFTLSYGKPILFKKETKKGLLDKSETFFNLLPSIQTKKDLNFSLEFDKDENLSINKVKFSQTNDLLAKNFYIAYDANLDFLRCICKDNVQKLIYENTTVTAENNQVFIVTRLPRAAIDSLIKQ